MCGQFGKNFLFFWFHSHELVENFKGYNVRFPIFYAIFLVCKNICDHVVYCKFWYVGAKYG
jgi:hypothetical protein